MRSESTCRTLPLSRMERGDQFRALTLRDEGRSGAIDPVLGVDQAWMAGPTFPPHPHAGFSAVSYVFADAETGLANRDSIGTQNLIRPGGLHWTAAGRGIVHEEVPIEPGRTAHLLQIFVNLPVLRRTAAPFALSLATEDVPVIDRPGARIRVPLGQFGGARSPLSPPTQLTLLDISLAGGAQIEVPVPAGHNAFARMVGGQADIDGVRHDAADMRAPVFPALEGERAIKLAADRGGAQLALFYGLQIERQS